MKQITHILARVRAFAKSADGAVTVDWVVLTASIVMLGVAAAFLVGANVPDLANNISSSVSGMSVGTN